MDIKTMEKFGAQIGEERVIQEDASSKKTETEVLASPEVARNIIANDALVHFAHTGYRSLLALATQVGFRIDEAALTVIALNLLYAAIQDATIKSAILAPDASPLTLQRHAHDLRKRFAGALRAWMRDDKQPEIQAWIDRITQRQLDEWRSLGKVKDEASASSEVCEP